VALPRNLTKLYSGSFPQGIVILPDIHSTLPSSPEFFLWYPLLQAHVQTNEDNLSEEVQTDVINYKNKWTQKPVSFRTKNDGQSSVDEVTLFSQVIFMVKV